MDPAPNNPTTQRPWLRRFCYLTILATFILIAIGGKVTSYDYGMALPGGFTTGGWLSFLAPLKYWFHDTDKFWEHTHRITATLVGFLTIAMTIWLLVALRDRSRFEIDRNKYGKLLASILMLRISLEGPRPWLRLSGVVMLLLVSSQGVMGALRVSEISLTFAFIHGIAGQLILCSGVVIAAALSTPWLARISSIKQAKREHATVALRWAVRVLLVLLLAQLTLGSAVRHFKADKAIPDFPLIYGYVIPPMSQESLDDAYTNYYADQIGKTADESGITNRSPQGKIVVALSDVDLQLMHRLGAVAVCLLGLLVIIAAIRRSGDRSVVLAPALFVLTLFSAQFALGVMTVLTGTDPVMATLHQATGAVLIAASTWLAVRIHLAEYAAQPVRPDENEVTPASAALPASPTPAVTA